MIGSVLTRLALGLMWVLHWLPLSLLAPIGRAFGYLLYLLGRERRHVALTNLRLCLPQLTEVERKRLARTHFALFGRSFLERGILWWAGAARIRRLVRIRGREHFEAVRNRPVILLVPHFVGLDMGWTRLTLDVNMVSIYANQKNFYFNAALYAGRLRFGESELLSRQEGIRRAIKRMQEGKPFYYLPDMDFGQRDTIFVPFFGVPCATITGISRLVRMTDAAVVPIITRLLPGSEGYEVEFLPAWQGMPGESIEDDTRRMNAEIENWVCQMPAQYFWLHKRFKTRPPGMTRIY